MAKEAIEEPGTPAASSAEASDPKKGCWNLLCEVMWYCGFLLVLAVGVEGRFGIRVAAASAWRASCRKLGVLKSGNGLLPLSAARKLLRSYP